jgi:hypothetical protein
MYRTASTSTGRFRTFTIFASSWLLARRSSRSLDALAFAAFSCLDVLGIVAVADPHADQVAPHLDARVEFGVAPGMYGLSKRRHSWLPR